MCEGMDSLATPPDPVQSEVELCEEGRQGTRRTPTRRGIGFSIHPYDVSKARGGN
jgi:hypothetical protein